MHCKKCGAQIGREDRRADGLYACPGCGAVYRVKAKAGANSAGRDAARASAAPGRAGRASKAGAGRGATAAGLDWRRLLRGRSARRVGIAAAALAVAVVALIALLPGGRDAKRAAAPTATVAPSATAAATFTPEPTATAKPEASVRFRAVGDIMSHKLQLTHADQGDGTYNYDSQFEYVKDALSKADYTIANLELSIATDGEYSSFPFFRTPEAILDALKNCGVDMFTMANNHILDGFYEGLVHTLDEVDERGFDHVGAYRDAQEYQEPVLVDINGIRFGFLAYTLDLNGNDERITAEQAKYCAKRLADADFAADVRALRERGAEVVICLPHWGEEGRRSVTGECRDYAQRMVDAGVDIILGSHPHVVLPINVGELDVNGEKKDILIAWSMGNFISYMAAQYMDSGIIVDFTVTREADGHIRIHDVGYVPVYVAGNQRYFHLICSGDFYNNPPSGMTENDIDRLRQSVREIGNMIGQDGVTMLQN